MNNRLEVLRARMHAEEAKAAKPARVAKPRAPKAKPVAPAPVEVAVVFDPKPTLLDAVGMLTKDELADPANVVRALNMLVFDEILKYQKHDFFRHITDNTLRNMVALQNAKDVRVARELCYRIIDACEMSSLNDQDADGSAGRRLIALERAIEEGQAI